MSTDRDATRIVRSWLKEDAHEDATRLLNAVLDQVDTAPQRRASWLARRLPTMNKTLRTLSFAAVIVGAVLVAYALLPRSNVGGPPASPSATVSPSASLSEVSAPKKFTIGPLVAGTYTSDWAGPTITFTLPESGWQGDKLLMGEGFVLTNTTVGGGHGISVVSYSGDVYTDVCSEAQTEAIGIGAADLIDHLAGLNGVQAQPPVSTTVGGYPAVQLDLTTVSPCGTPDRMWLWATLPGHRDFHFNDGEHARVIAVDTGGATIVVVIEAFPGADYDLLIAKATTLLETMTLEP